MLERASACLDTGVRISLRAQKSFCRSQRLLHSTFWHHGANDLEIPPSGLYLAQPECLQDSRTGWPVASARKRDTRNMSTPDDTFLDFLYPPQALALMYRASDGACNGTGGGSWPRQERRRTKTATTATLRGYASMSIGADGDIVKQAGPKISGSEEIRDLDGALSASTFAPNQPLSRRAERPRANAQSALMLKELMSFTSAPEPGNDRSVDRAWEMYKHLDENSAHDSQLLTRLILYFSTQKAKAAADYVVYLFDLLPQSARRPAIYKAAIAAWLQKGASARAVRVHNEAWTLQHDGDTGASLLMKYAVMHCKWHMAIHVLRAFEKHTHDAAMTRKILMRGQREIQGSLDKLSDLVRACNSVHKDSLVSLDLHRLLDYLCGKFVMGRLQILSGPDPELVKSARRDIRELIEIISKQKINAHAVYENCILQLCAARGKTELFHLISYIYQLFSRSRCFLPSVNLLRNMLVCWRARFLALGGKDDATRTYFGLQRIVHDWKRHHHRLDDGALFLIMESFARLGHVTAVQEYAAEYKALHVNSHCNVEHLWPLIYAHARTGNTTAASAQLRQLPHEYGVTADLRCWNVLLFAYEQANDIAGALNVFGKLAGANLKPDVYTYGPLISMYSQRGDVDGVADMLAHAEESGVIPSTLMLNGLIVAHANNDDIDGAEAALSSAIKSSEAAKAAGKSGDEWGLTLCFNSVITAHALRRDINKANATYTRMREAQVPIDGNTYAALIQVLCFFRQTNSAYATLRNAMPDSGIRPSAVHYAMIMAGYINQGMYDEALDAHAHMEKRRIRSSISTRLAYLKAKTSVENRLRGMGNNEDIDEITPPQLQEAIGEMLHVLDQPGTIRTIDRPEPGFRHGSPSGLKSEYFSFLVFIHGKRRCFQAVQQLFSKYTDSLSSHDRQDAPPMRLLTALMSAYYRAQDYAAVEECWHLAREQADRMRATPRPPGPISKARLASDQAEQAEPESAPIKHANVGTAPSSSTLTATTATKSDIDTEASEAVELHVNSAFSEATATDVGVELEAEEPRLVSPASGRPVPEGKTKPFQNPSPPVADSAPVSIPPQQLSPSTMTNAAPSLRFILSRPLRFYLLSASAQNPSDTTRLTTTVTSLLSAGYAFDNQTWNAYIVTLCKSSPPRALLAFTLTERFLIPNWPGWIDNQVGTIKNDKFRPKPISRREGLTYIRTNYIRPGFLVPQYKTMVYLARALLELRSYEVTGKGRGLKTRGAKREEAQREVERQVGSIRAVRERAPRTMHEVQSLPRVYDSLQAALLRR